MNLNIKLNYLNAIKDFISEKIKLTEEELLTLTESRNGETKSTAGDKHETGRALVQTEIDNLQRILNQQLSQKSLIDEISTENAHIKIGFGSLVEFNKMAYFVSVGLGRIENLGAPNFFAISTEAPIFKEMIGKGIGEEIQFNGQRHLIDSIC